MKGGRRKGGERENILTNAVTLPSDRSTHFRLILLPNLFCAVCPILLPGGFSLKPVVEAE